MRIVIDLQGIQTENQFKGFGYHSLALIKALVQNSDGHEIWLALNASCTSNILKIRKVFEGLIPPERIQVFRSFLNILGESPESINRISAAKKIWEYFIQNLQPDIVLTTVFFGGNFDSAVRSIGADTSFHTAIILYDPVSLTFLSKAEQKYYESKVQSLKRANLLLTVSDYLRQNIIETLDVPPKSVVNISASVAACFKLKSLSSQEITEFYQRHQITRKMILYGAIGLGTQKNLENLMGAYNLLPIELRNTYQIVVINKLSETAKNCPKECFATKDILFLEDVSKDDLVKLYNLSTLYVQLTPCEGFAFSILEAMACGLPVIASDHASFSEFINFKEVLFDANSPQSISDKIKQALNDKDFYTQLREHSLQQAKKFSWERSAKKAWEALKKHRMNFSNFSAPTSESNNFSTHVKPRLAFISPLPPAQTGIADYSADLLPELSRYFEIELITDSESVELPFFSTFPMRSINWFKENGFVYDRMLYQFGNSVFHAHMFELLELYPGIVVLHDFFLSNLLAYEEMSHGSAVWLKALFHSHGYHTVQSYFEASKVGSNIQSLYPCNLEVLQNAKGIIVHSQHACQLASQWYGNSSADHLSVIPMLKAPAQIKDRLAARRALGIREEAFVVCSFGVISPHKLNSRLLYAWLSSSLHENHDCELIFVGTNPGGKNVLNLTDLSGNPYSKIRITGWIERETYIQYLQVADISVQLRSSSSGETSAAILDCMNYGLATITNAHGSMAELPNEAVWMMPNEFTDEALRIALETLWTDTSTRMRLGKHAREYILEHHDPGYCAYRYYQEIESIYQRTAFDHHECIEAIMALDKPFCDYDLKNIAQSIAGSYRPTPLQKQLFIDVTNIARNDIKGGIERVIRAQLLELIKNPPPGFRIEPVFLNYEGNLLYYCYARQYTATILGFALPPDFQDTPIDVYSGDLFYILDYAPYEISLAAKSGLFLQWRALGVQINVLVYDLLPILKPHFFPSGADQIHMDWLKEMILCADRLIGISSSVVQEIYALLEQNPSLHFHPPLKIAYVPLGADIIASAPSLGIPTAAEGVLKILKRSSSFLMVGTIEPRKGYLQALAAFEQLWHEGYSALLVIVGKEGWRQVPDSERRTIPRIVKKLRTHPELGKRLFWLESISDEYLQEVYKASTCFLTTSEGEGFGLPLIEAAHYNLPIIARDIPVFREIAQEHAYYFAGLSGYELACSLKSWIGLYSEGKIPISTGMKRNTWTQSIALLKSVFLEKGREEITLDSVVKYDIPQYV